MNHFSEQSQINERLAKLFSGKVSSFHYVCTIASLGSGTAKMAHKMAQESGRSKDLGKTKFTYVSKASVGKTPLFGVKFHPNVDGAYFATAGDNQVRMEKLLLLSTANCVLIFFFVFRLPYTSVLKMVPSNPNIPLLTEMYPQICL